MSRTRAAPSAGTLALGAALFAVAVAAWVQTVRDASPMSMPGVRPAFSEGMQFILAWGVMMAAMMLPSAVPMLMLYRTVSRTPGTASAVAGH